MHGMNRIFYCRESVIDNALNEQNILLSLIAQLTDSVIGTVTTIRPESPRDRGLIPVKARGLCSLQNVQFLQATQLPVQWILGGSSSRSKRPGRESKHKPHLIERLLLLLLLILIIIIIINIP